MANTSKDSKGNSVSFGNTPQAKDDFFASTSTGLNEDSNNIIYLDVMANDLGGKAKALYSLDNADSASATTKKYTPADLLTQDVVGVVNLSKYGAEISITADGKIAYNMNTDAFKSAFQSLTAELNDSDSDDSDSDDSRSDDSDSDDSRSDDSDSDDSSDDDSDNHDSSGDDFDSHIGYDTFTYAIRLSNGTLSWATATVEIAGRNDAPRVSAQTANATEAGSSVTVNALKTASDVDTGTRLKVVDVSRNLPAGVTYDKATHSFTLDPNNAAYNHLAQDATTNVIVSYAVSDGITKTPTTITFTVTGTNDGPAAIADVAFGSENEALTIDVLANDTDIDDSHVFTLNSATAPDGKGAARVADNKLLFTPGTDFDHLAQGVTETVTLSYEMQDEQGAKSTSTVEVTITGTNDGPLAVADVAAGTENEALTIDVLANDTDLDDGHMFTLNSATAPDGKGTASVADNKLLFTPDTDFDHLAAGDTETVTLSYEMRDAQGAISTSTVNLTITGANDGPLAVADVAAATENEALTIDVLANDIDIDDDHVFTLNSATAPDGKGTASVVDNKLLFAPGTDFDHLAQGVTETVTLSYEMQDEQGAISTSTVNLTITGTNDGPLAVADVAAGMENEALTIDVLANDTDLDDGHVFTLNSTAAPVGQGSASVVDNKLLFTPGTDLDHLAAGDTATVSLSYEMQDGQGAKSTSTANLTITGSNDGPTVAAPLTSATDEDQGPYTIDLLAGAADVDSGSLLRAGSVIEVDGKGGWSVDGNTMTINPDFYDDMNNGEQETLHLNYQVIDEHGTSVDQSLTVTIAGITDAPSLSVATSAGSRVNEVRLIITSQPANTERVDLNFDNLPGGALVLDQQGKDVTTGVDNYGGTHSFTVVLAENQDVHQDLSVTATGVIANPAYQIATANFAAAQSAFGVAQNALSIAQAAFQPVGAQFNALTTNYNNAHNAFLAADHELSINQWNWIMLPVLQANCQIAWQNDQAASAVLEAYRPQYNAAASNFNVAQGVFTTANTAMNQFAEILNNTPEVSGVIGQSVQAIDLSYDVSSSTEMVTFDSNDKSMWGNFDGPSSIGWHEYIPFIGGAPVQWDAQDDQWADVAGGGDYWRSGEFTLTDISLDSEEISAEALKVAKAPLDLAIAGQTEAANLLAAANAWDADTGARYNHAAGVANAWVAFDAANILHEAANITYNVAKGTFDIAQGVFDLARDIFVGLESAYNSAYNTWQAADQAFNDSIVWILGIPVGDPFKWGIAAAAWTLQGTEWLLLEAGRPLYNAAVTVFNEAKNVLTPIEQAENAAEGLKNSAYNNAINLENAMHMAGYYTDRSHADGDAVTVFDSGLAWAEHLLAEGAVVGAQAVKFGADGAVLLAQGGYNLAHDALALVDFDADLQVQTDLFAQAGLQVDFVLDSGSVDTNIDYQLTSKTQYNQTTDMLAITPLMTNMTSGATVAFDTISPNVKFHAAILYDVGADLDLTIDGHLKVAGQTIFDLTPGTTAPIHITTTISTSAIPEVPAGVPISPVLDMIQNMNSGELELIDFDSARDLAGPFEVPGINYLLGLVGADDILKIELAFPTVQTAGVAETYSQDYFTEGGLVGVDFSEITGSLFNLLQAKIDYSPEMKLLAGISGSLTGGQTFEQLVDNALQAFSATILDTLDGQSDGVPVFLIDATDETSTSLIHVNTFPDNLSTINADTASFGFFAGYDESEPVIKVSVDLDQAYAFIVNEIAKAIVDAVAAGSTIAVTNAIPTINPYDLSIGMEEICEIFELPKEIADYLNFKIGFQAADLDVHDAVDFSQEFTLSIDDMSYMVTLEDGFWSTFTANGAGNLLIENASSHDANHDGVIGYSLDIVPTAMFSNDTEIGLSMGYVFDLVKAGVSAGVKLPLGNLLNIPAFGSIDIPGIDISLGPLLRIQGDLDLVDVDVFESRFALDIGSDSVTGGVDINLIGVA